MAAVIGETHDPLSATFVGEMAKTLVFRPIRFFRDISKTVASPTDPFFRVLPNRLRNLAEASEIKGSSGCRTTVSKKLLAAVIGETHDPQQWPLFLGKWPRRYFSDRFDYSGTFPRLLHLRRIRFSGSSRIRLINRAEPSEIKGSSGRRSRVP